MFTVDDDVLVTAEVLYRDGAGDAQNIQLSNEAGIIKKLCSKDVYYVSTQYGIHYLYKTKLTAAT